MLGISENSATFRLKCIVRRLLLGFWKIFLGLCGTTCHYLLSLSATLLNLALSCKCLSQIYKHPVLEVPWFLAQINGSEI